MEFVHLHLHTEYSLLDGAIRLKYLPGKLKSLGMNACAITDHGSMYGCLQFYEICRANGIKPIIGCEVYIAPHGHRNKNRPQDRDRAHLILLAENNTGLRNLNRLVSIAHIDGFYYKPRIDRELLAQHSEGLIGLSACLSGEIPQAIKEGNHKLARELAAEYRRIFIPGSFFLELQDNRILEQKLVNSELIKIARELDIPLVATNDAHYLEREDAHAHDILLCMQTGRSLNDPERMRMPTDEFYLKSPEEMTASFAHVPEAIYNTVRIAERCTAEFDFTHMHLPSFAPPDGFPDAAAYLRHLSMAGLNERLAINAAKNEIPAASREEYVERLNSELDVIISMGYTDYYLTVWDYIRYAKENGIIVGPGRGSGCGSLVAWSLGITNIDSVRYQLFFERFLNPERVSMPDFDVDFCYERRQEVIDYVTEHYGQDKVSQVITFGTLAARACVRDVARAMDLSPSEVNAISALIPQRLNITLEQAEKESKELAQAIRQDPKIREIFETAKLLEGMPRHASTHAAGVIICAEPIMDIAPIARNDESLVVQYTKDYIEDLGLLKFDILGLRTLTVLQDAADMIKQNYGVEVDYDNMPMDDPEVFQLISSGDTAGVFQLESGGMTSFMRELKPSSLEDIIAGIALYRPGPMEQIPNYVAGRHDPSKIKYDLPILKPILEVTYGCIVYQEQVMQMVRDLAGFSLGQSDIVRRAMSKKTPEVLQRYEEIFLFGGEDESGNPVPGCISRGIGEAVGRKIYNEIQAFAGYAFNKSHATGYAVVTYQTAWLKCYYRTEFMAALLNSFLGDLGQAAWYIQEAKKSDIAILPVDINQSQVKFSTENNAIRFALGAVKNVGNAALQIVVAEREENGPFVNFADFLRRCAKINALNRRMIESLVYAGAFDSFGRPRTQLLEVLPDYMEMLQRYYRNRPENQISIFDLGIESFDKVESFDDPDYPDIGEMPLLEKLAREQEMLGVYVTGHPLDDYRGSLALWAEADSLVFKQSSQEESLSGGPAEFESGEAEFFTPRRERAKSRNGETVKVGGLVIDRDDRQTRKGSPMSILRIEDQLGTFDVLVFERGLDRFGDLLKRGAVVGLRGKISFRNVEEDGVLILDEAVLLHPDCELNGRDRTRARRKLATNGYSEPDAAAMPVPQFSESRQEEDGKGFDDFPKSGMSANSGNGENESLRTVVIRHAGEYEDIPWERIKAACRYFSGNNRIFVYLESEGRLEPLPQSCAVAAEECLDRLSAIWGRDNVALL
ncbi:MAG: DNA polymerase III subunit alpha [Clostridiaceae bacterium]|nr:DNA polymerase III subunit alpha [Clostridiaceae bacterium]